MNLFVINLKNLNDYRSYDHFIFANNESIIVTWETKNTQKSFHFTLNNKIPVYDWYINEVVPMHSISWSNTYLENFINTLTVENIKNNKNINEPYFNGCKFHLYAFEKYIDNIKKLDKNWSKMIQKITCIKLDPGLF
jgi:hypothetical protein